MYFFLPQTHQTFNAPWTSVSSQSLNPHKLKKKKKTLIYYKSFKIIKYKKKTLCKTKDTCVYNLQIM